MNLRFILFFSLIIIIYIYIDISKYKIDNVTIKSTKISKDIRIVQISDFHCNRYINEDKLLREIKDIKSHIIVLTGDIIGRKDEDMNYVLNFVEKLLKINPNIFFVQGNHEVENLKGDKFIYQMNKLGVEILQNKNKEININGEIINICGINFYIDNQYYEKLMKNINAENYTIILSHSPTRLLPYLTGKEDLILAGHTHGGQVRLPVIGAIIAPDQGYFPKYDKGLYKISDNTLLYIDSGLGNSVLPLRFLNRVQFSKITLTR